MIESMDRNSEDFNNRILICDDNEDLHKDFIKILNSTPRTERDLELNSIEDELFHDDPDFRSVKDYNFQFRIDSAFQGKQALRMAEQAAAEGDPYAIVFMDVRMPPGWDGVLTIERIWRRLPYTEAVIVTAYSDYSWDEMIDKLGVNDKLLFIKKPFDTLTVKQLAINLTNKWNLASRARKHISRMEEEIKKRMEALDRTIRGM